MLDIGEEILAATGNVEIYTPTAEKFCGRSLSGLAIQEFAEKIKINDPLGSQDNNTLATPVTCKYCIIKRKQIAILVVGNYPAAFKECWISNPGTTSRRGPPADIRISEEYHWKFLHGFFWEPEMVHFPKVAFVTLFRWPRNRQQEGSQTFVSSFELFSITSL